MAADLPNDWTTHPGMRYAVLDLMRCTEQTAILMAGAEGRGIRKDEIAMLGTLSTAAFIADSIYAARRIVYDELYERTKSGRSCATGPGKIWTEVQASHKGRTSPRYRDLELDFCFSPVDGKNALSQGQTGGTVSSISFARHDAENPVFAPPRKVIKRKRGHPADADLSPPWLVICGSHDFVDRHGGESGLLSTFCGLAQRDIGLPVEGLIHKIFDPGSDHGYIRVGRALAVLDEPRYFRLWNRQAIPDCKKRVFVGSSVALALAALLPNQGFDCSIAITRHAHAVQASVAAKALDGGLFAVPLHRVPTRGETKLCVESDKVWTRNDFVRHDDAALIVSGISENVVLKPVRVRRSGIAEVHTISLSARTRSMRIMEHRIRLDGDSATRFVGFDAPLDKLIEFEAPIPRTKWRSAREWCKLFCVAQDDAVRVW